LYDEIFVLHKPAGIFRRAKDHWRLFLVWDHWQSLELNLLPFAFGHWQFRRGFRVAGHEFCASFVQQLVFQ
jgi:hypothetical protein